MVLTVYFCKTKDDWMAVIPGLPTSAHGATREAALEAVIQDAYAALAFQLKHRQRTAAELSSIEFQTSDEQLPIDDLAEQARVTSDELDRRMGVGQ